MSVKLNTIQIMLLLNLVHSQLLYLESQKEKYPGTETKIDELRELVKTLSGALSKPLDKEV